MFARDRRQFLVDVGRGMLLAGVGPALAAELGLAAAADGPEALTFGELEPLVGMMQETPADRLLPLLVERMRDGADLRQLVSAAALANARTFGGEDYVGFHTMMALAPAFRMAGELPQTRQPLPVLKVLYRNTRRIQEKGGRKDEVLHPVKPGDLPDGRPAGELIREAVQRKDMDAAERTFAAVAQGSATEAFNQLLVAVQDCLDVHRVVMPYRAWALLDVVGPKHAHTLLRQSIHYCVKGESERARQHYAEPRALLPKLLEQHRLLARAPGQREADDAWIDRMSWLIFESSPAQAAEAVAMALAEGMAPSAVGEAMTLAANQLVLRDAGRRPREVQPGKPLGSVHGDSIGVHACDSANAWRNMARVSNARNTYACLILGAYQVAFDRIDRGGEFLAWLPRPYATALGEIKTADPQTLLQETESAIKANDQARACALVQRYGNLGHAARPVFDLLLRYAVSEDGALHAEKYYATVAEEFAATRPAFRWRHVVALARVTASEYGQKAPGYAEACQLLRLKEV